MNTLKSGLAAVILSTSFLYGADTINEQIQAIQKASVQERAELMNKLKIQIASMNEEERANAINTLRTEVGGKTTTSGISPAAQRLQQMQSTQQSTIMQRAGDTLNTQHPRIRR